VVCWETEQKGVCFFFLFFFHLRLLLLFTSCRYLMVLS
jgi:hypothetical protein